jgi:hypothetical protein
MLLIKDSLIDKLILIACAVMGIALIIVLMAL